ncbi:MAG: V-type ATP synthase subunit D [Proteobacteria bacterium]|nr:V-type ATP synthase subunit D [Pseudomonadota bacterium]
MDIKPTRSNLLLLKEKKQTYTNILSVLKARRLALIKELLTEIEPYLKTQAEIKKLLNDGLMNFQLSKSIDGIEYLLSLTDLNKREFPVTIISQNIYGLKYKEVKVYESIILEYDERKYNPSVNSSYLELFEKKIEEVIEEAIKLSNYENKIKIITDEIMKLSKKIKVIEERLLPKTAKQIKYINIYLGEKERENYFRLKLFKNKKTLPLSGRV